jgi:phage repressor protein C with HTH and peptisase S24 domain
MEQLSTTLLSPTQQEFCRGKAHGFFVSPRFVKQFPTDALSAAQWLKAERAIRNWSTTEVAKQARGLAIEAGEQIALTQQSISNFEQGTAKRIPAWLRYVREAFENSEDQVEADLSIKHDDGIMIRRLPTFVGLGSGGTGDGDEGRISFSRDLIENELRAPPDKLLAMVAEGNSMEPEFRGGDQILVDTRRRSLAQPGAFCLWDGDGHVIKYLERVPDSEPVRVRVVSANDIYEPRERLLDEIGLIGRVIWFGRRIQ